MNQRGELTYTLLGPSGLRVSKLCLRTMTFGEEWGWGADKATSQAIFTRFVERGGNFIDTANNYTNGTSEGWLGEFIHRDRDRFVIGTKYSLSTRAGDPNSGGNHRKSLVRSLEASLRRLRTDYVDVYWLHVWDSLTPVDEILRALDDVVRAGKVLYLGISDVPAWIVSYANAVAELRCWSSFIGVQAEYSLARRDAERDLLPKANALGLTFVAWSPLANGLLTGKYNGAAGSGARMATTHRPAIGPANAGWQSRTRFSRSPGRFAARRHSSRSPGCAAGTAPSSRSLVPAASSSSRTTSAASPSISPTTRVDASMRSVTSNSVSRTGSSPPASRRRCSTAISQSESRLTGARTLPLSGDATGAVAARPGGNPQGGTQLLD